MIDTNTIPYHPSVQLKYRSREEIIKDVTRAGCNDNHCIGRQLLVFNQVNPDIYLGQENGVCHHAGYALDYLRVNNKELVLQDFLAALKYDAGKILKKDIKVHGSYELFRRLDLNNEFENAFSLYIKKEIEIEDLSNTVFKKLSLEERLSMFNSSSLGTGADERKQAFKSASTYFG